MSYGASNAENNTHKQSNSTAPRACQSCHCSGIRCTGKCGYNGMESCNNCVINGWSATCDAGVVMDDPLLRTGSTIVGGARPARTATTRSTGLFAPYAAIPAITSSQLPAQGFEEYRSAAAPLTSSINLPATTVRRGSTRHGVRAHQRLPQSYGQHGSPLNFFDPANANNELQHGYSPSTTTDQTGATNHTGRNPLGLGYDYGCHGPPLNYFEEASANTRPQRSYNPALGPAPHANSAQAPSDVQPGQAQSADYQYLAYPYTGPADGSANGGSGADWQYRN